MKKEERVGNDERVGNSCRKDLAMQLNSYIECNRVNKRIYEREVLENVTMYSHLHISINHSTSHRLAVGLPISFYAVSVVVVKHFVR